MRLAKNAWLATLVLGVAVAVTACGGSDTPEQTTPTWQPSDRLPTVSVGWWSVPPERICEETSDCRSGEQCRRVRLGTCPQCPRGEVHRICVGRDGAQVAGSGSGGAQSTGSRSTRKRR